MTKVTTIAQEQSSSPLCDGGAITKKQSIIGDTVCQQEHYNDE